MAYERERREYRRFKVMSGVFALNARFGQVVDISLGGIAFHYVNQQPWTAKITEYGALFGEDDLCLDNIPMQTVTDVASAGKMAPEATTIRRRGLKFGPLTLAQRNLLEHFIWVNTVAETPADPVP